MGLLACAAWLHNSLSVVYGLLAVYFGLAGWLAGSPRAGAWPAGTFRFAALGLLALAGAMSFRPVYFMSKPGVSEHAAQHRVIRQHLRGPVQGVVFVDDFLFGNYDFYYGYQVPPGLRFRRYSALDSVPVAPPERAWLLVNGGTLTNPELTRKLIRYSEAEVLSRFPRRRLVARDGRVSLYQVR